MTLAIATIFLAFVCGCRAESPPPSVLVVVLDTVGANALGAYGNPRPLSPQFDAVAEAGALFEDVTAPGSWTWPSHAALFTGEPPWVSGAHAAGAGEGESIGSKGWLRVTPMRADLPTLAERLGAAGYATSAFVANRLLSAELGLTRGFEQVVVTEEDARVAEGVVRQLAKDEARPQLVFVNFLGAHSPYHANGAVWSRPRGEQIAAGQAPDWAKPYVVSPPGISFFSNEGGTQNGVERYARGEFSLDGAGEALLRDLYEGEVLGVDRQLNAVIKAWTARYPEGVVIVTADHGELLGEHGLLGHGSLVYSRLTRVPLAMVVPGTTQRGARSPVPVQIQDLYATILALAGIEKPAWTLLDALNGQPRPGPVLAAEWPKHQLVPIGGRLAESWRLIRDGQTAVLAGSGGSLEMYDLAADPWMDHDLAATRPEAARALAEDAARRIPMQAGGAGVQLDEAQLEALRELGYVER